MYVHHYARLARGGLHYCWLRCLSSATPSEILQDKLIHQKLASLKSYKQAFPSDSITNNQIDQYVDLVNVYNDLKLENLIRIGVIYGDNYLGKIIETILADPLASGNGEWFKAIDNRDKSINNQFIYGQYSPVPPPQSIVENSNYNIFKKQPPVVERQPDNTYKIPSPILSSIYRPNYWPNFVDVVNPIQLTEINQPLNNYDDFHFLIHVSQDLNMADLPESILSKVLFSVIDNTEYSPPSSESTPVTYSINETNNHIVKINSRLAYDGIGKFLALDTLASDEFIISIQNSNLFEIWKAISWYLNSMNLSNWLLKNIINRIQEVDATTKSIESLSKSLVDHEITDFSKLTHHELQYDFIPKTSKFFNSKLTWWKLYYKNDNIEYDLKDFFNENFMNNSIENYNYLRGFIVSKLKQNNYANYSQSDLPNPLQDLKVDLINNRLTNEIQPKVFAFLTQGLIYYQLPISLIAWLSWQYFGFSSDTAFALGLLGWVAGFNHVAKSWYSFTHSWLQELFEQVRICLGKDCIDNGLLKELNSKVVEEIKFAEIKNNILKKLKE